MPKGLMNLMNLFLIQKMQRCKRVTVIKRFKREGQEEKLDYSSKSLPHPLAGDVDQNRG